MKKNPSYAFLKHFLIPLLHYCFFLVYNVSAPPLDQSKSEMVLQHLSPGQEYEAWIRAMTAAGPGEKTTLRFKTKHQEYFGITF